MVSSARQAVACILLILCVAAYAQAQSSAAKEQTASISGKVTVKGKGAAGIVVVLIETNSGLALQRGTTDDEGKYRINNIPPGNYHAIPLTPALIVEKAQSKLLVIAAGEVISDVDFAMVRGGVITGRITNADGQAIVEENVSVQPVNPEPENTEYNFKPLQTDDRGIYRAFGLRPGKYRVSIGDPVGGLPSYARQSFRQTFYPSVIESDKATLIEITEGSEIIDVDIVTSAPASTFTVSGRLIDGQTGKPLPGVSFGIQKTEGEHTLSSGGTLVSNSNGEFKIQNAGPGRYTLVASLPESNDGRVDPLTFDVVDRDLTGLEMKTRKGASLSGTIVVEGSPDKSVTPGGLYVFAWIEDRSPIGTRGASVGADGSFKLNGLPAGNAHLSFSIGDPRESKKFDLLRIEHNGVPQPGGISVREGEQVAEVRVIVKYVKGNGAIHGQVKIENGQLPPSTRIMLWAAPVEENSPGTQSRSFGPGELDSRGRFLIEGLAAGTYELRGLVIESNRRYEITKQLVTVNDNAVTEVSVNVKLKP